MRHQTCTELWNSLSTSLRTPGGLVNKQTLLRYVLIGMIVIILGYMGLSRFITGSTDNGNDSPETLNILVADRYIPAYSPVKPRDISVKSFQRGYVPPGALQSADELKDAKGQPLFLSAVPIPAGQAITRNQLIEIAKSHGLASLLTTGKVAVSFAADKVRGVGNWIQPGDSIALFHTPALSLPGRSEHTRLLFRSLLVLAVDKNHLGTPSKESEVKEPQASFMDASDDNGSVITVLLNSFEAPLLIEAEEQGHLTAALHAIGDELVEAPLGK
jgi:Flp pilus assembly protein CpaB